VTIYTMCTEFTIFFHTRLDSVEHLVIQSPKNSRQAVTISMLLVWNSFLPCGQDRRVGDPVDSVRIPRDGNRSCVTPVWKWRRILLYCCYCCASGGSKESVNNVFRFSMWIDICTSTPVVMRRRLCGCVSRTAL